MKRPFKSRLAWMFDEFSIYMETSGTWNNTYNENLHYFDNYLADKFLVSVKKCWNGVIQEIQNTATRAV